MPGTTKKSGESTAKVLLSFKPEHLPKSKEDSKGKLWFKGVASTEDKDLQGETVLANGLDFSYFIDNGWFDDEHSKSAADGMGVPTLVQVRENDDGKREIYTEGYLYDTKENRRLHRLMKAMKKAGDGKRLGLSIQGPVKKRTGPDGKTVAQAWVKNIAITRNPVNPNTYMEAMEKSLTDFADELCKAMADGGVSDSGMSAGYPVPTYMGGGNAAALMTQELVTKKAKGKARRKKMKLTIKKAEWEGMTDEVKKSLSETYEAQGIELELVDDAAADGGTEDQVTKSLPEQADELVKSLTEAKDALVNGGVVVPFTVDKINEFNDAIKAHTDALNSANDFVQKSIGVMGIQNDRIASLEAKVDEMVKSVSGSLQGIMNTARTPEAAKSVDPATVVPIDKPNTAVAAPEDGVDGAYALGEISKAYSAAEGSKKNSLKGLYESVLISGFNGTKDELSKAIANA